MKILFNFYFLSYLDCSYKVYTNQGKKSVILLSFDELSLYIEYFGGLTTRCIVTESVPFLLKNINE